MDQEEEGNATPGKLPLPVVAAAAEEEDQEQEKEDTPQMVRGSMAPVVGGGDAAVVRVRDIIPIMMRSIGMGIGTQGMRGMIIVIKRIVGIEGLVGRVGVRNYDGTGKMTPRSQESEWLHIVFWSWFFSVLESATVVDW